MRQILFMQTTFLQVGRILPNDKFQTMENERKK